MDDGVSRYRKFVQGGAGMKRRRAESVRRTRVSLKRRPKTKLKKKKKKQLIKKKQLKKRRVIKRYPSFL